MLTNLHIVFFLFLCEHSWDPAGANFAIFQCCHHRFEANIQFHTQFLGHSLLIFVDELIETLFISWCDSCAWWSEMQLAFRSTAAFAEMHHSPPYCAHIHCWVPINVQQALMNVNRCHFFCMEEFSVTPLLHPHFYVRCYSVRLPLCCHLSNGKKHVIEYWRGVSASPAMPTSTSDVVGQENKICGITFGAILLASITDPLTALL